MSPLGSESAHRASGVGIGVVRALSGNVSLPCRVNITLHLRHMCWAAVGGIREEMSLAQHSVPTAQLQELLEGQGVTAGLDHLEHCQVFSSPFLSASLGIVLAAYDTFTSAEVKQAKIHRIML